MLKICVRINYETSNLKVHQIVYALCSSVKYGGGGAVLSRLVGFLSSGGHFMKYWGGECQGLVRFICPCHGRGVRGHAPMGKF